VAAIQRLFTVVLSGARDLDRLDDLRDPAFVDHSPRPGLPS
jgi:hypothetical protein